MSWLKKWLGIKTIIGMKMILVRKGKEVPLLRFYSLYPIEIQESDDIICEPIYKESK